MKDNGNFPFLANQTGKFSCLWHHGKHSYTIKSSLALAYQTTPDVNNNMAGNTLVFSCLTQMRPQNRRRLKYIQIERINIKEGLLIKQTRHLLATFINLGLKSWFIFSILRPFKYIVGTIMYSLVRTCWTNVDLGLPNYHI
jgi:hypothetical protein